ncbi:MAG TPA: molecular chaperone [Steroidobacteraceae bacterium]|nr:molecular chaperone [Steroidobacteraceae bacterium]
MNCALRASYLTALIGLATAGSAVAGTFVISPIRVELSAQQKTEALTVRNEDTGHEVVVQARAFAWSQHNGQDELVETRDVIVTPPVFTLAGGAQQIIRVAIRRPPDPTRELTYRLIVQEVPQEARKDFTGLQVALRLSLPIFLASQSKSAPDLHFESAWQKDGALRVTATNQGAAHIQVTDFIVRPKIGDGMLKNSVVKYVLPGATIYWDLPAPADPQQLNALKQGALILRGASDKGEIAAELTPGY